MRRICREGKNFMKILSLRQRYLSLVARLYELAAEFDDAELKTIHQKFASGDSLAVQKAVNGLLLLHYASEHEKETSRTKADSTYRSATGAIADGKQPIPLGKTTLESLLKNREAFPTLADILKITSEELPHRPKEGRERYERRLARHVGMMPEAAKQRLGAKIAEELSKRPSSFVSRWKSLILES